MSGQTTAGWCGRRASRPTGGRHRETPRCPWRGGQNGSSRAPRGPGPRRWAESARSESVPGTGRAGSERPAKGAGDRVLGPAMTSGAAGRSRLAGSGGGECATQPGNAVQALPRRRGADAMQGIRAMLAKWYCGSRRRSRIRAGCKDVVIHRMAGISPEGRGRLRPIGAIVRRLSRAEAVGNFRSRRAALLLSRAAWTRPSPSFDDSGSCSLGRVLVGGTGARLAIKAHARGLRCRAACQEEQLARQGK